MPTYLSTFIIIFYYKKFYEITIGDNTQLHIGNHTYCQSASLNDVSISAVFDWIRAGKFTAIEGSKTISCSVKDVF
jgi:hypothetical protein